MANETEAGKTGTYAVDGQGSWRCTMDEDAGPLWYFTLAERRPPPYVKQVEVKAIVDIADDGTVAGIEIIDGDLQPPRVAGDGN